MRNIVTFVLLFTAFKMMAQSSVVVSGLNEKQTRIEAGKGHFQWVFPSVFTKEKIDALAQYYKTSFTYVFDGKLNKMDIYPVKDSEETRRIMLRFLGACQFNTIQVDDKKFELYDFYNQYMQFNEKE